MKVVSICSQKGGVGKTTLALNLGVMSEQRGLRTVLIDVDAQQSLVKLADERGHGSVPDVVSAQAARVQNHVEEARQAGADLIIIDTGPNSEIASKLAMQSSDHVLIPCKPSPIDLKAIESSLDLARAAGDRPKTIVITMALARSSITDETAKVIRDSGYEVAPVVIYQRLPYVYSTASGQAVCEYDPASKAAEEVAALWQWLAGRLAISPGKTARSKAPKPNTPRSRKAA
jgi:chromosome partitioning protein